MQNSGRIRFHIRVEFVIQLELKIITRKINFILEKFEYIYNF